jgi:hypothetical protein
MDMIDQINQAKQEALIAQAVREKLLGNEQQNPYLQFLKDNCLCSNDNLYRKSMVFHSCPVPGWHSNSFFSDIPEYLRKKDWPIIKREEIVKNYAWAIPNAEAILELVNSGPVIEIGAGTGYWAHLVRDAGGVIYAYDRAFGKDNEFTLGSVWTVVLPGGPEQIKEWQFKDTTTEFTLFLCWPPYATSMALDSLREYTGKKLIYVGEQWGCTGDEAFQEELDKNWNLDYTIEIPVWWGVHDAMYVYSR